VDERCEVRSPQADGFVRPVAQFSLLLTLTFVCMLLIPTVTVFSSFTTTIPTIELQRVSSDLIGLMISSQTNRIKAS
jgi:hypothetical protein